MKRPTSRPAQARRQDRAPRVPDRHAAAHIESLIAAYAAKGVRVALLAEFYGTADTGRSAEPRRLGQGVRPGRSYWARTATDSSRSRRSSSATRPRGGYQYGDEPGEPSYPARAQTYAVRLKESAEAITAGGIKVGLLDGLRRLDRGLDERHVLGGANLGSYITGWISHPYGTGWKTKIEDIIKQAAAHGAPSTLPIDVTEWGIATDNGRCLVDNYGLNPCMTYQEAAETMRRTWLKSARCSAAARACS